MGEVAQAMEKAVSNINELNRNMENLSEVGHDFTKIQEVWSAFAEGVRGKRQEEERNKNENEVRAFA